MGGRHTVVVTNRAFPETLALLAERFHVIANSDSAPWPREELMTQCRGAFGILAFMSDAVDEAFLAASPDLKIIACALKGSDNFDVLACTRRGVWVSVVREHLAEPTAELAVGLMLDLSRGIVRADRYIRAGCFNGWRPQFYGMGVDYRTVGLLGGGLIGRAIARKLSGFSCQTLVFDERDTGHLPSNARWAAFDEVVECADFLVLALPLNDSTFHLVNESLIGRMKSGCCLINPARGSLIDENAVAAALEEGRLGGYAADVFEFEDIARAGRPSGINPRLLALRDKTVLTAHMGSAVMDARRRIERDAALNIIELARGERPHGAINNILSRVNEHA